MELPQLYAGKGGEILVNTSTIGSEKYSQIEMLANGGFVATWTDYLLDGSDATVRTQLFDADGNKVGSEFQANTITAAAQYGAKVAALPSGRFVIVWEDQSGTGGDNSPSAIKGQLFEVNGTKVGGEFLVNSAVTGWQSLPTVTGLANGGFVVAWEDRSLEGGDASVSSIKAQIFDADAVKVGGEFLVNSTTVGSQMVPVIASQATGGFVAAWVDFSGTNGEVGSGVRAQRFDSGGAKIGPEIHVNTITTGGQSGCAIATLQGGGFVVTWGDSSRINDQNSSGIKGQLFDANGVKVGGEFLVNSVTQGGQFSSQVAALPGGGFLVTWGSGSALDLTQSEIKGQFFDAAANKIGTEFLINSTTVGEQSSSSIAVLPSGDIVISWTDGSGLGGDASGSAIKMQILTPATAGPTDIVLSNSTVSETSISNFAVAQIGAIGASNTSFNYEIVSDPTGGAFRIEGDLLVVANNHKLDFETAPTINIRIRATDLNGQSFEEAIALTVTDALVEARYAAQTSHLSYRAPGTSHIGSTIVALANGGSLSIWSADPNNVQFGQFRDATGAAIGLPFDLGIATVNPSDRAAVALPSGGFIVAFQGYSISESVISAQFYDSSGAKVGSEIVVAPGTPSNPFMPTMVHLDSGEIVVAWHAGAIGSTDVYAQRLSPAGIKIGTAFKVNTTEAGEQGGANIVALANGGFVISWADGASQGIRAQLFDNAGAKQGSELVLIASREDLYNAGLAALEDGSLVLLIVEDLGDFNGSTFYSLSLQRYDANGAKIGNEIAVTPAAVAPNAQLIALPNGGFAVAWENVLGDIQVQLYSATGTAAGDSFLANGGLIGSSGDFSMSATGSGDLLFSWTRGDVNESGTGRGYITDRRFTLGEPAAPPASNVAPAVTTSPGAINYVEATNGQNAVAIDPALGLADPDNPYAGAIVAARVQITGNYRAGEDQLNLPPGMSGNGAFDSATGTLTITANGQQLSVDDWRLVIGNIRYINVSDVPSTATRTLSITVSDGTDWSAPATKTITITPANDAPTIDLDSLSSSSNASVTYGGGGTPIAIMPNAIVTDTDSPSFAGGAVRIERAANPAPSDILAIQNQGDGAGQVGVSGNVVSYGGEPIGTFAGGGAADLVVTLSAGATAQAVQAMLRAVTYANSSSNPQSSGPQYAVTVSDGAGGTSTQRYSIINIAPSVEPTNFDMNGNAPGTAAYVTYQAGGQAVAVAPDALVTDADTTNFIFRTFRYRLTTPSAGDSVTLVPGGPIGLQGNDVTYNGETIGQLVNVDPVSADILLGGQNGQNVPIDAIQAVVRAIRYSNSSGEPAAYSRTISIGVNEGSAAPNQYYTGTVTVGYGADTSPTAVADAASVAANRTIDVAVLANDTDPDGGPKGVVAIAGSVATVGTPVTLASGARVTLNADGSLKYDPNGSVGAGATDTFSYTLNGGSSASVAVSITAAIDTAPTAVADTASVAANRLINIAVLANDTDPDGGPKTVATIAGSAATVGVPITLASGARVTLVANGELTYDPNGALGAGATDVFTYALNGGSSANVSVNITAAIDTPPTAVADSASVEANATTVIAVLLNDTDPDGGDKAVAGIAGSAASVGVPVTLPSGARVTLNADGTLTYNPNGALGAGTTDSFSYSLNGGSSAIVTVNIVAGSGGDTPPTAVADTASVAANATAVIAALANDTDPDGGPKSVVSIAGSAATVGVPVTLASGARVTLNADGTLTYNPNGAVGVGASDSFSYGLNGGSTANVAVSVTAGTANGMLIGSPAADVVNGGAAAESFNLSQGGADQVTAAGGNDGIYFGAAFGAGDVVDGGAGTDTLALQGDYGGLLLSGVTNVEVLLAASGSDTRFGDTADNRYDYNIATVDTNVPPGATLTVIGSELLAGEDLIFNGAAETDGRFRIFAGRGNDTLTGGAGSDGFLFGADGNLTGADRVNGGAGTDSIALRGNYVGPAAVVFQDASFSNVEVLTLLSGHTNEFGGVINTNGFDYDVTLANGTIASGQRLDVIAGNLRANESARVDARAELDGSVRIISGAGNDILFGSAGNDILSGGLGADALDGSAGNDSYVYRTTTDSTAASRDTIALASGDKVDLSLIDAVTGTPANEGFTFIGSAAFSNVAGQLRAVQSGDQWIVEGDVNGDGAADLVIAVTSAAPLAVADFIL